MLVDVLHQAVLARFDHRASRSSFASSFLASTDEFCFFLLNSIRLSPLSLVLELPLEVLNLSSGGGTEERVWEQSSLGESSTTF